VQVPGDHKPTPVRKSLILQNLRSSCYVIRIIPVLHWDASPDCQLD